MAATKMVVTKEVEIGTKVLVPRTGGGYTKGEVVCLVDKLAVVSFPIGDTYRGEPSPYDKDETAIKRIAVDKLVLL